MSQPDKNADNRYFIVDLSNTDPLKLNIKPLTGKDGEIILFNVYCDKDKLVLFSVFSLKSASNWSPIDLNDVKEKIISAEKLKEIFDNSVRQFVASGGYDYKQIKRDDFKLIIKKGSQYFLSGYCTTEFFSIFDQQMMFPNLMESCFINVKSPLFTIKNYESRYKEIYNEYSCNSILSKKATGSSSLLRPLQKPLLFFSGTRKVGSYIGYQFWQFTDWRVADGLNTQRGIDRFIYVPDIGIVAGAFDFWFEKDVDDKILFDNYLAETVIMPELINGKKLTEVNPDVHIVSPPDVIHSKPDTSDFEAPGLITIKPREIAQYLNKPVITSGLVTGIIVSKENGDMLLKVGAEPSGLDFYIRIKKEDINEFDAPDKYYDRKHIKVVGNVLKYGGKPAIEVTRPSQIQVVQTR